MCSDNTYKTLRYCLVLYEDRIGRIGLFILTKAASSTVQD